VAGPCTRPCVVIIGSEISVATETWLSTAYAECRDASVPAEWSKVLMKKLGNRAYMAKTCSSTVMDAWGGFEMLVKA
jgi:hypothetical protein